MTPDELIQKLPDMSLDEMLAAVPDPCARQLLEELFDDTSNLTAFDIAKKLGVSHLQFLGWMTRGAQDIIRELIRRALLAQAARYAGSLDDLYTMERQIARSGTNNDKTRLAAVQGAISRLERSYEPVRKVSILDKPTMDQNDLVQSILRKAKEEPDGL